MSLRIIHTADWHLGNRMHRVDRYEEFRFFFGWLKKQIETEKADALVVSGDVFDTINPPTESRAQYNDFLASLLGTCCRNVIIVGGNHDSGALLDSEKDILRALNIHVVGSISNIEPEDMVFELKDSSGETVGICCGVPYGHEVELRKYCAQETEKGKFSDCAYGELYRQVFAAAENLRSGRNIPVIATGHLYAANLEGRFSGELSESDSSDDGKRAIDGVVGNLGSVHEEIFPKELDYVALGHIHYTSMVNKNPKIRYSGSPFILGFDEASIPHGVLCVEIERGEIPQVKKINAPSEVVWQRLTGDPEELKEALEELKKNPPEKETNIEVNFNWKENLDINEFLHDAIEGLPENVFVVHIKRNESQKVRSAVNISDVESIDDSNITYETIFKTLIATKKSMDITGKTEDEVLAELKKSEEEFLPLFMECVREFEAGDCK